MGEGAATLRPSADYSSNQNNGKKGPLSPILSIITRWHDHGRTSLSISYICVGGEADLRPWWILTAKKPTRGEFQTTETKLVAVSSSESEDT